MNIIIKSKMLNNNGFKNAMTDLLEIKLANYNEK